MWENADIAVNYIRLLAQLFFGSSFILLSRLWSHRLDPWADFGQKGLLMGVWYKPLLPSEIKLLNALPVSFWVSLRTGRLQIVSIHRQFHCEIFPLICNQNFCNPVYYYLLLKTPFAFWKVKAVSGFSSYHSFYKRDIILWEENEHVKWYI